jgi:hypothetical protein
VLEHPGYCSLSSSPFRNSASCRCSRITLAQLAEALALGACCVQKAALPTSPCVLFAKDAQRCTKTSGGIVGCKQPTAPCWSWMIWSLVPLTADEAVSDVQGEHKDFLLAHAPRRSWDRPCSSHCEDSSVFDFVFWMKGTDHIGR